MQKQGIYYAATSVAVLLWSASFIATKIAYTIFSPLMVGFIRFFLAAVILWLIRLLRRDPLHPKKRDLWILAASGLLGITLYFAAENIGVQLTTASNASLIVASYPSITALFEFFIYRIKPTAQKIAGIVLAFCGIGVLTISQDHTSTPQALYGNLFLLGAGIVWTFYNFITRSIAEKYSPLTLSCYQMTFGTIFFIPLVFLESGTIQPITLSGVLSLVYLACGCSVAAFLLYNFGLRKLSAATSISLMNLVPVFGLIFSTLFLQETISLRQILGGIIVILGVVLSSAAIKVKLPR